MMFVERPLKSHQVALHLEGYQHLELPVVHDDDVSRARVWDRVIFRSRIEGESKTILAQASNVIEISGG